MFDARKRPNVFKTETVTRNFQNPVVCAIRPIRLFFWSSKAIAFSETNCHSEQLFYCHALSRSTLVVASANVREESIFSAIKHWQCKLFMYLEENPSSEFDSRWPTWKFFAYYEIGRPIVIFTRTLVCPCAETIQALSPPSELSNQNTVCVSYPWYVRAVSISFLGSFVILRIVIISCLVSVCLSVRMGQLGLL
jgi:hypothetical protein